MSPSLLEKRLSLKADFLVTGLNGIGTVVGIFIVSGYLARTLGLDALGEYLLVRRIVTAVLGVLLLGMNVALPTFLARNEGRGYGDAAFSVFLLGTLPLIVLLTLVITEGFIVCDRAVPYMVYGVGFCALTLAYALYRGHLNMIGANLLQFTAGTVVSLVAVVAAQSIGQLFIMIGFPMIILSFSAFLVRNGGVNPKKITKDNSGEMLIFGVVRIPGFIFQFFLLAGVPLLSLSYLSLTDQAFLNAGISLVRVFLVLVGPLGIILLPRISHAVSGGIDDRLRSNLSLLVRATFYYGILTGFVLNQLSGEILTIWLGEVTDRISAATAVLLISVPVFVLSAVLRSPIDAGTKLGYNSLIYGAGAAFMTGFFYLMLNLNVDSFMSASVAFLSGQTISGIGSYIVARKLFNLRVFDLQFVTSAVIAFILTAGAVMFVARMTTGIVTMLASLL
ncbi:MAG TPA: hypothetical protein EYO92_06460, partial [Candidatus Marinimicrobia bacterium]|nr:hypothetical protein [Candidatus Neomarinimicrobiota bacterium]